MIIVDFNGVNQYSDWNECILQLQEYLAAKNKSENKIMAKKSKPIREEKEIQQNPDQHIDQDFPGFPDAPADKKSITPVTKKEKKAAGADKDRSSKTYGGDK